MSLITTIGIDPGLVHTGVVVARFNTRREEITVEHEVIAGSGSHAIQTRDYLENLGHSGPTFIEAYTERGTSYGTNPKMRELLSDFRTTFPYAVVLDNMGIKSVVKPPLLRLLGLDKFPTTHHQDLQSAARIMVFGMLKDERLNSLVADVAAAYITGHPWFVQR